MLKTILISAVAALALAVPTVAAAKPGRPGAHARDRVHHVRTAVARHCGADADQATQQRCAALAQKAVAKLQQLDARIDAKLAEIQARCSGTDASQTAPGCSKAQRVVDALTRLKQHLEKIEAWIQAHGQAPAGADDVTGAAAP
ncbi:MAG TPA: hypothetical protein VGF23_18070 [Gaiellaceae bacterium]|jgi:hypothetical protein